VDKQGQDNQDSTVLKKIKTTPQYARIKPE
jgi:hypothetical protein